MSGQLDGESRRTTAWPGWVAAAALVAGLVAGAVLALTLIEAPRADTAEIDAHLEELATQVSEAQTELGSFNPGLVADLVGVRLHYLKGTAAMLERRKAATFWGIGLQSVVDGHQIEPDPIAAESLRVELDKLDQEIAEEKSRGLDAGSLVGGLSLATVATMKVNRAMLQHAFYSKKYGLPSAFAAPGSAQRKAPGRPTEDDDAL